VNPSQHTKLGAFVVLGVGIGLGALLWLGAAELRTEKHEFVTFLDESVAGLEVGSPVRFRGVTLGQVSKITVAPNNRFIEVHAEIPVENIERLFKTSGIHEPGEFVPEDIRVQLVSSALTGVKTLQVDVFADLEAYPKLNLGFPEPEHYIPSVSSTLKDLSDSLSETFHRLPKLTDRLSSLSARLEQVLVEVDAPGLSQRVGKLLDTTETKLEAVDAEALVRDTEAVLDEARETFAATRALIDEVRAEDGNVMQLVAKLNALAETVDEAVAQLKVEETGAELRKTAQALGGVAAETTGIGPELQDSLRALREAADAVNALAEALKRDPGSLLHGRQPASGPPGD